MNMLQTKSESVTYSQLSVLKLLALVR